MCVSVFVIAEGGKSDKTERHQAIMSMNMANWKVSPMHIVCVCEFVCCCCVSVLLVSACTESH